MLTSHTEDWINDILAILRSIDQRFLKYNEIEVVYQLERKKAILRVFMDFPQCDSIRTNSESQVY